MSSPLFGWLRRLLGEADDGRSPRTGQAASAATPSGAIDLRELEERLRPFVRTAWIPEVADGDGAPATSKFSGTPVLARDEPWPRCGNCDRPMQLFLQLKGDELPAEQAARLLGGYVQLFYCTSSDPVCESDCDAWAPHARSTLLRLLPAASAVADHAKSGPADAFPAKRIVGWTAVDDVPNHEELEGLGLALSDDESEALNAAGRDARDGEKLSGWPLWIQGIEYPRCRQCGREMELLFQIDSEKNLPYMFGDVGVGHVTQCAEHRDELAFGWACS